VDRGIARFVARRHGVISRRQLRDLGLSGDAIDRRVVSGRLHVVHRGVYAVGHTVLTVRGRWIAAVLAGGAKAVLSHASAAALWELRRSASATVDVSVTGRAGRMNRTGVRIHRPRTLKPTEVTTKDGIPTTTPARTILDLAATLQPHRLERLLDQAEILQLTDYPSLDAIARAHPGHRGAPGLRSTLAKYQAGKLIRSDLEARFFKLCDDHALPTPKVNESVAGKEVDFLFVADRLIVETDSWEFHRTRQAFERDRARDALLLTHGYRTIRITHRALEHDPRSVAATIRTVLEA
jgi:very-short-patch-repair endonuclease